jgi:hypothetical protein
MSIATDMVIINNRPMRLRICLRTFRHECSERSQGFPEECLIAGRLSGSFLVIDRAMLNSIRLRHPKACCAIMPS